MEIPDGDPAMRDLGIRPWMAGLVLCGALGLAAWSPQRDAIAAPGIRSGGWLTIPQAGWDQSEWRVMEVQGNWAWLITKEEWNNDIRRLGATALQRYRDRHARWLNFDEVFTYNVALQPLDAR